MDFDNCDQFGLEPENLVGDDYEPCQDFAERCREDASLPDTVVVPSAALPGTRNLVIFGARVSVSLFESPIDAIDIPVSIAAEDAGPLDFLIDYVRYFNSPHKELDAWKGGQDFEITLPAVVPLPLQGPD